MRKITEIKAGKKERKCKEKCNGAVNFDFFNGYFEDIFRLPQKVVSSAVIKESSKAILQNKRVPEGTNDLKICMLVQIRTLGKIDKILWGNLAGFSKT